MCQLSPAPSVALGKQERVSGFKTPPDCSRQHLPHPSLLLHPIPAFSLLKIPCNWHKTVLGLQACLYSLPLNPSRWINQKALALLTRVFVFCQNQQKKKSQRVQEETVLAACE